MQAIEGKLAEGTTSVGYRVQLDHLAPTAVGGKVRAEATLETIEGRRLTFRVSVSDGHGLVAAGRITRVIVERARFLEKATGDVAAASGTGRGVAPASDEPSLERRGASQELRKRRGATRRRVLELRRVAGVGDHDEPSVRHRVGDAALTARGTCWSCSPTITSVGTRAAPPSSASWSGCVGDLHRERRSTSPATATPTCGRRTRGTPAARQHTLVRRRAQRVELVEQLPQHRHPLAHARPRRRTRTSSGSMPGGGPADVSMSTSASTRSGWASTTRRATMPPIE